MLNIQATPIPITIDDTGTARIGNTRVTLDVMLNAFKHGATAEEITHQFSALDLADVYAVIAYYLRETDAVETYLINREEEAQTLREEIESAFSPESIRARLMAKRNTTRK